VAPDTILKHYLRALYAERHPRLPGFGNPKLAMELVAAYRKCLTEIFPVMPINHLVKQHAFAPDEIKLLVAAFEEAL